MSLASTSTNASVIEQSQADLDLLIQNLDKSKRVTDRLVTGLKGFDSTLSKLESSVLPIHRSTSRLTRGASNIEHVLRALDGLLGYHDLVETEEQIIIAGPDPTSWINYTSSLDRLLSASDKMLRSGMGGKGGKEEGTWNEMQVLLQTGARKLLELWLTWVEKETPESLPDASELITRGEQPPTFPPQVYKNLQELLSYIRRLPGSTPIEKEFQSSYADVRGAYFKDCLKNLADNVTGGGRGGTVTMGTFLDVTLTLAESEYDLLTSLFPPTSHRQIFSLLLPPSLQIFTQTCQSFNNMVKRALTSTVYLVLDAFAEFQSCSERWDEVVRGRCGRKDLNELGEAVHWFRGSCLRSFPELIEEAKEFGTKPPGPGEMSNAAVSGITVNVINFMRQLVEKQSATEGLLTILGKGNWMVGGRSGSSRYGTTTTKDTESLLSQYLGDVLYTLLESLSQRSEALAARTRPGFSTIFLLNNISYVRREVISDHQSSSTISPSSSKMMMSSNSSQLSDLLPNSSQEDLNKRMKVVKADYHQIWSPLVSVLMDPVNDNYSGGGATNALKAAVGSKESRERSDVKDRFVRFNQLLEEIENLHRVARLEEGGGAELRRGLKDEVNRMLVPYGKFVQKHKAGDFSKNPSKYLRLDGAQLQGRLDILFE